MDGDVEKVAIGDFLQDHGDDATGVGGELEAEYAGNVAIRVLFGADERNVGECEVHEDGTVMGLHCRDANLTRLTETGQKTCAGHVGS